MAIAPNPLQAIIARIQGGGGAPSPGLAPQGPGSAPGPEADGTQGVQQLISRMIELGAQATSAEKDPVERAALAKIVAQLHQFAANEQKDHDAAMGAGPAVKVLRRTAQ